MTDLFPGWYPDPEVEDQDRWWNGVGWVDRVLPKGHTESTSSPLSGHRPGPGAEVVDKSDSPEESVIDLRTPHIPNGYVAWDGLTYTGEPPEGWYLASDDRWWAPNTGPDAEFQVSAAASASATHSPGPLDAVPSSETSTTHDSISLATAGSNTSPVSIDNPASTADQSEFSLPAVSYRKLEKLPSAQVADTVPTKKSSWWKRNKA